MERQKPKFVLCLQTIQKNQDWGDGVTSVQIKKIEGNTVELAVGGTTNLRGIKIPVGETSSTPLPKSADEKHVYAYTLNPKAHEGDRLILQTGENVRQNHVRITMLNVES